MYHIINLAYVLCFLMLYIAVYIGFSAMTISDCIHKSLRHTYIPGWHDRRVWADMASRFPPPTPFVSSLLPYMLGCPSLTLGHLDHTHGPPFPGVLHASGGIWPWLALGGVVLSPLMLPRMGGCLTSGFRDDAIAGHPLSGAAARICYHCEGWQWGGWMHAIVFLWGKVLCCRLAPDPHVWRHL